MNTNEQNGSFERELETRYQTRLDQEIARLREQSHKAVEDFKRSFPPPSDQQIERLLYPELSEFSVELGGRRFHLRELPALVEKRFFRLVEQRLPALIGEILSFEERLGDNAVQAFTHMLTRATSALDLVADACALVLDPAGEAGVTREFVQQHASTAYQLRILQAQLLLNGARDFLSRLFPALRNEGPALRNEGPALTPSKAVEEAELRPPREVKESVATNMKAEQRATHSSSLSSVGSNSFANHPE